MTFAQCIEQQGVEEGMRQSMQQITQKFTKRMLQKGMDYAFIEDITGLSEEEIKQLQIEFSNE